MNNLQAKGFQWSIGIHGTLVLAFVVLQLSAVSQTRIAVIDFTLSGEKAPPTVERPVPRPAPPARQTPKPDRAVEPKRVAEKASVPVEKVEQAQPLREVQPIREEPPASLTQPAEDPGGPPAEGKASAAPPPATAAGSGMPSANGGLDRVAGARGSTQAASGNPGDAAGAAPTPEASRAAYLKEHFAYIRDRITGSISYPHMARKMGWCGQVKIAFVVCENGGVNDVRVVESSGFGLLDRNAVDTVKNVAPFPCPPVRAEIKMAITYRLN
jgi:periplasmic protein TonB